MSYQYKVTINTLTPIVVGNDDVKGSISAATFHTVQCMGSPVTIEIQVANNATYLTVGTYENEAENINAFGITKLRLTVPTGSANVSIAGTINAGGC